MLRRSLRASIRDLFALRLLCRSSCLSLRRTVAEQSVDDATSVQNNRFRGHAAASAWFEANRSDQEFFEHVDTWVTFSEKMINE